MKLKDNNNIFCTISAGYSSVLMGVKLKEWFPNHNIIYAMANTSKEREESLHFMNECDKYFGLNMVWIEAKINQEKRKGTDFNIVTYENLKRNGELFEDGIKKYGIPCKFNKWCNRELKLVPLKKYADSVFGKNTYSIAVGLRADEMDRVLLSYKDNNVFYPLLDKGVNTRDRNKFWKHQPIKLNLPAYKGNCDFCFEKSIRKLMTIANEDKHLIKWWGEMECKYSTTSLDGKDTYNKYIDKFNRISFFRDNRTVKDIEVLATKPFSKATDEYIYENDLFDLEGDCGAGCKVF
ncbi:hypothetical protein ACFQ5N_02290 [Lutibacter holmesii]|uniref:Phosphoadenosine phosphosulphate reductase domain-containing protein n=1 Tax=Lutibacter holmesii TaxID=1137985 RepID=A0ABW3WKC2_9FLAO